MGIDFRFHYLKNIRQATNFLSKPFHVALNFPNTIYTFTTQYFSNQYYLIHENELLKLDIDRLKADLQRLDFLDQENNQLKNLLEVKNLKKFKTEAVSIIYSRFDPFNQKIIIDGGQNKNFQAGQPVIDGLGLVGQISSVFPETSEVTLLIDKKMSVPIQIQRNGLRAITNGNGQKEMISLSYLPNSVDVIQGDILRTSGIDTIYPEGLAVAEVVEINNDPKLPFAKIICKPIASIRNHSHLLVVITVGNLNNPKPFKNDQKK
jgi:rod shape-determining protein MreC